MARYGPSRTRSGRGSRTALAALGLAALLLLGPALGLSADGTGSLTASPSSIRFLSVAAQAPPAASPHALCPPLAAAAHDAASGGAAPRASVGGYGGLSAHSVDPAAVPNTGFRFNVTQFSLPPSSNGTFLLEEEETIADQLLVMGFLANTQYHIVPAIPFWAVVSNTTGRFLSCGYSFSSPATGATVSFQANHTKGRTWEVSYQGSVFPSPGSNNITMNGSRASWTGGLGVVTLSNWNTTAWVPSLLNLTDALRVNTSAGWYLPHPVVASWNGSVAPAWGEAGTVQRGYLPPGELQVGSSVPAVGNGTPLWNTSAPTSLAVALTATPSSLLGGNTSVLVVRENAAGLPISNLSVSVTSSLGGTFSPAFPWPTNATGVARGNFTSPLESGVTHGNLTASVGNALYLGTSPPTAIVVYPVPVQLNVVLSPASSPPGGLLNFSVSAVAKGAGVAGLRLSIAADTGGGTLAPSLPWVTDTKGLAHGTYRTPSAAAGSVGLFITVTTVGYHGSAVAWLNVTSSPTATGPSPATASLETAVDLGLLALLLVEVGAYAYLRRRPPRRPLGRSTEASGSAG